MARLHIFIPASEQTNGNAIAKNIFPDVAEDKTFGTIQLKILGGLASTVSHYGCNGLVTEDERSRLLKALSSPGIKAVYYRLDDLEKLEATNSPTAAISIGQAWSWEKSLSDMKLEMIVSSVLSPLL